MKNVNLYNLLWLAVFSIGILLLSFMIITEGEPGGIPLILIAVGVAGYLIRRFILQPQQGK